MFKHGRRLTLKVGGIKIKRAHRFSMKRAFSGVLKYETEQSEEELVNAAREQNSWEAKVSKGQGQKGKCKTAKGRR
jgi:hypothetical protein